MSWTTGQEIAITGHRPDKLWNDYELTSPGMIAIRAKLQHAIDNLKPSWMISGMAQGIDTLWAELALENEIPLIAAIPCRGQEEMWPQASQDRYWRILDHRLTSQHWCSPLGYTSQCMQDRNKWMVMNSDALISVWDGSKGGTSNCTTFAKHRPGPYDIFQLNPFTLVTKRLR